MPKIGDRVGAILSATQEEVRLLGYGVYEGEQIPSSEEHEVLNKHGLKNSKLKLDNNSIVWGCECWWGSEEIVKQMIGDRKVILVDIDDKDLS